MMNNTEENKDNIHGLEIEEIVTLYGDYIYNFALKLSAHPLDAEDLAQETIVKAWQYLSTLQNAEAIKKWLRTICLNLFRDRIKEKQKIKVDYTENLEELEKDGQYLVVPSPSPADEAFVSDEIKKLRDGCFLAMTRRLTLNQRLAFSLVDMFGLSINETAHVLAVTPKAVKGLLYRARMNLESFFKEHCSMLDANNPCQCRAWIDFVAQRAKIQNDLSQKLEVLDYRKQGYTYDEKTRKEILYYYQHLPQYKPSDGWYTHVILLLEKFFIQNT